MVLKQEAAQQNVRCWRYSLIIFVCGQLAVILALDLLPGLPQLLTPDRGTETSGAVLLLWNQFLLGGSYQVVDDVEAVVLAVVGVDAAVGLLPHVVLQRGFISEGFLAVQTLQTDQWSPS